MTTPRSASDGSRARFVRGAGLSLFGRVLGRGIYLGVQVLLARSLGAAAFGLFTLAWTVIRTLEFITVLGLPNGLIRFASLDGRRESRRRLVGLSLLVGLLAGMAVALVLATSGGALAALFDAPDLAAPLRLLALAIPMIALLRIATAASRVGGSMGTTVLAQDVGQPLLQLAFLALLLPALDVRQAALATGLSFLVAAGLALLALRSSGLFNGGSSMAGQAGVSAESSRAVGFGQLLRYSLTTSLVGLLANYVYWIDRLFLGYFHSPADVGTYQVAAQIVALFPIVLTGLNTALAPWIPALAANDRDRLRQLYRISTTTGVAIVLPAFLLVCFAGDSLIGLVFGPDYPSAYLPMVILACGQLVNVAVGAVGILLVLSGHHRRWLAISLFGLILGIVLNVVLIPPYKLVGAATGTAVALAFMFLFGLLEVRRQLRLSPFDRGYVEVMSAGLAAAAAGALTARLYEGSDLIRLGAVGAAIGVAGLVVLWLSGSLARGSANLRLLLERPLQEKRDVD